jgi:hypothetical protein
MHHHPTESLDLPDQHDYADAEACEALATTDHPDSVIDALADAAAWEARCEAVAHAMALRLAGGDAWLRDALALSVAS